MSKWSGKTRGGVFGYSFFILLIKYTNVHVVYGFLRIVALYFLIFSKKKSILFYFRKIHNLKGFDLIKSIYKNYVLLGEIIIDKILFMIKPSSSFTFDYDGEEYLSQMANDGKGGMLIGAHMGNFELAGDLLKRIDTKVNIVLLDAEHLKIKHLFEVHNIKRNFDFIPIKNDFTHLFKIKEALNNNEFVVIQGDRYMNESQTVSIDFMGKPAKFTSSPLYIASKCGVPVSFVFTLKESSKHYHFYATQPQTFNYPGNLKTRKQEIKKMVEVYVSNLEKMVHKYPTQWFNYFPYWEEEN